MRSRTLVPTVALLVIASAAAALAATDLVTYPGVANLAGVGGTAWRTSATLSNPTTHTQQAALALVPRGGGAAVTATITLEPGEVRSVPDLYASLGAPDGAGSLTITGEVQSWVRVFNLATSGTFGMAVPGVRDADLFAAGDTDNHTGTADNVGRWASFRAGLAGAGSEVTVEELETIASYHANPGLYPWTPADVYNMGTQQVVVFDPATATLEVAFHPRQGWLRATPRFEHLRLEP